VPGELAGTPGGNQYALLVRELFDLAVPAGDEDLARAVDLGDATADGISADSAVKSASSVTPADSAAKSASSDLTRYEQRVFDRVSGLAVSGVVPLTALTFRDENMAQSWWKQFRAEVVAGARSAGRR
jgi:hypothetical protein